ncbi:hypothetical protein CYMTET_10927 [Cymbomonas tetramitiformis]|uniref:mannan endo-1,4-beta-mannosidase n=1 Tax=Cymbomonas tetramitiformis TaxID=36881 RepID=A0AAE0GNS1_9CHLO|nr:hypothetical protein CYMTET_10927 [Cymbomonas tetramitiformis]|eukprot:gene2508-3254_t
MDRANQSIYGVKRSINGTSFFHSPDYINGTNVLAYLNDTYEVRTGATGLLDDFVRTDGTRFVIGRDGCDFVFAGFNLWQAVELATNTPMGRRNPYPGRFHLNNLLNEAVAAGFTVIRVWGHTVVPGRELMSEPGVYNEEIFHGIDYILDEARKRGLKIEMIFADNWKDVGSVKQFANNFSTSTGDFFSQEVVTLYKNHLRVVLNRVNSINGITYKNDPTIMAWNLANELRCKDCDSSVMQSWIEDICSAVKTEGTKQMVSIGTEGFYGPDSPKRKYNPGEHNDNQWASKEGQDFVTNSQTACIDFASIHVWPDNWNLVTAEFQTEFIMQHVEDAQLMNKPLILEEFGKVGSDRDKIPFILAALEVAERVASLGGSLRGTLFYHLYDTGIGPGDYGIWSNMTTFSVLKDYARAMNDLSGCLV